MAGRCLNNLISIFVNRFIILEKCTVFADEALKIKIHRSNHLTPKIDFTQSYAMYPSKLINLAFKDLYST